MNRDSENLNQIKKDQNEIVANLNKEDKVEIEAICFIRPLSTGGLKTFKPGDKLKVAKSEAKEFCERKFDGYTEEAGTKPTAYAQPKIVRAKYVK